MDCTNNNTTQGTSPQPSLQDSRSVQTMDGCQAAAHVAYAYSECAAIYPITPSSPMAELCHEWAENGLKNIFGNPLVVSQLQSEAGAAAAVHGALLAGSLAVTFTASQGLLLMLPNLYRMAGELLPGVIHVAARSLATHALSIFGDHSDIYACRQTGVAIFCQGSVQEVMDLSPVAHLAALEGRIPFVNFFDGFRTSHELHKIRVWDYKALSSMLDMAAVERFRERCLHPSHGKVYGSAQNPDIFFQAREASNPYYQALPDVVEKQLGKINKKLGTSYGLFDYYGSPHAEHVIIAMGSICECIKEYLDSVPDKKYGLVSVHLYRPFSSARLAEKLPRTVRQITVLDRTKEPGAPGEPLYLDVAAALAQCGIPALSMSREGSDSDFCVAPDSGGGKASGSGGDRASLSHTAPGSGKAPYGSSRPCGPIYLFSGRYGLSSKDTTPAQMAAVYENHAKPFFTVGIRDDVTHLSLDTPPVPRTAPADIVSCKFWGLGGDGTVSATKNAIKIIGSHTDMTAQGYFEYDSKKSRGLTISHLRFGKSPIRSTYLIRQADFVACHNPVYLHKYDMVQELKDGGTFLLNCGYGAKELERYLPDGVKTFLAMHRIRFYVIDALRIGKETGLNSKISTILQAAFFAVSGLLPAEDAKKWMKQAAEKSYGKSGAKILEMNRQAIERGFEEVTEIHVPEGWQDIPCEAPIQGSLDNAPLPDRQEMTEFVTRIQQPVTDQRGNSLPVSAFLPYADGYTPPGSTAHERRAVATEIPRWKPENCIQCTRCSFFCPHAVIRPAVLDDKALEKAPEGLHSLPMFGLEGHSFAITLSPSDCTGCGTCAAVCPGKQGKKALEMTPVSQFTNPGPRDGAAPSTKSDNVPASGESIKRPPLTESSKEASSMESTERPPLTESSKMPSSAESTERPPLTESSKMPSSAESTERSPLTENSKESSSTENSASGEDSICIDETAFRRYQEAFDYCKPLLPCKEAADRFRPDTPKGSQFLRPLMEFSGACAGCGETAYVKLLTQLFGSRMYIANATGCSSIWGNSAPSCAYALDADGHGPAWSNSLFEDAAEFGFGMLMAQEASAMRSNGPHIVQNLGTDSYSPAHSSDDIGSSSREGFSLPTVQWIIGGDGWAYDIGFSGLDHVLASGKNINILVLDTEVYSNTGGQASKATPAGSTAKFALGGKKTRKKDLAAMAMTYGNVYVAQIAMGADMNQTVKAFTEAAAYPGPSLVIAYATCIAHGIRAGLGSTPHEAKKAVDAGYYHLFRFNPALREQGKHPLILDSGEAALDYEEFLDGEIRYDVLKRRHPEQAEELFGQAEAQARERYRCLKELETIL